MSPCLRRHLQFAAISLFVYVPVTWGSRILARMRYRNLEFAQSASEVFDGLRRLDVLEVFLFLLLGMVCASLACQSLARGVALLVVGLLAFTALYFFGAMDAEAFYLRRAWTAASLAAAFTPFKCAGVLALIVIVRALLDRPDARTKA